MPTNTPAIEQTLHISVTGFSPDSGAARLVGAFYQQLQEMGYTHVTLRGIGVPGETHELPALDTKIDLLAVPDRYVADLLDDGADDVLTDEGQDAFPDDTGPDVAIMELSPMEYEQYLDKLLSECTPQSGGKLAKLIAALKEQAVCDRCGGTDKVEVQDGNRVVYVTIDPDDPLPEETVRHIKEILAANPQWSNVEAQAAFEPQATPTA